MLSACTAHFIPHKPALCVHRGSRSTEALRLVTRSVWYQSLNSALEEESYPEHPLALPLFILLTVLDEWARWSQETEAQRSGLICSGKSRTGFPQAAHPWLSQHPGAVPRTSHGSIQQPHKVATVLHPHFTDEEIEACGNQYLPEVTQLVSGRDSEIASLISQCVLLTPTLHLWSLHLWSERLPTSKPPPFPSTPVPHYIQIHTVWLVHSLAHGWEITWHQTLVLVLSKQIGHKTYFYACGFFTCPHHAIDTCTIKLLAWHEYQEHI